MSNILPRFNPPSWSQSLRPLPIFFFILIFAALTGCDLFLPSKPNAIITSPPSGSTFHEGEDIAVQSVSTDAKGVVRVELIVDGQIVRTDAAPSPQDQFTLVQTWKATAGSHTIIVKSYNGANNASDPAAISVSVIAGTAPAPVPAANTATPAPTSTTAPGGPSPTTAPVACTNNSAFVQDMTIPDGTVVPAGATVIKTWRMSNNGTCAWGAGYQIVFVSGEAMTTGTVLTAPSTPAGATADLSVSITAPAAPGSHTGTWRLRSSSGALFGQAISIRITVPGAVAPTTTPTVTPVAGCTGTPTIAFFNADATTITAGSSTTLRWGAVTNADTVEIDQGIGGVAAGPTGGSQSISPTSTKTFTMTARCGANSATKQVIITVPFAVLSATASAVAPANVNACSNVFNFSGTITTNGAGTVTYQWDRSDHPTPPIQTITFSGAGSQTVTTSWSYGTGSGTTDNSWEKLHVLTPNVVISNQADVQLKCP